MRGQKLISDYVAMQKQYTEQKKQMDGLVEQLKVQQQAIIAFMQQKNLRAVVIGDQTVELRYVVPESAMKPDDKKANLLAACGGNRENAKKLWDIFNAKVKKQGTYTVQIVDTQPFNQIVAFDSIQ